MRPRPIRHTYTHHGRRPRRAIPPLLAIALGAALGAAGCQSSSSGLSPGLSGMRTDMKVISTEAFGPYLAAHLQMGEKNLDAYVMPSEPCKQVFTVDTEVVYVDNGPMGDYRRDDFTCQGLGVGNLVVWRDRSQHQSPDMVPRAQAAYHVVYRGKEYALLRGQFPGSGYLGFTGSYDLMAIVPVGGECAPVLEQRTASIEYRDMGNRVLSLVGPTGLCDIHGLAQPPPQVEEPDLIPQPESP